LLSLSKLPGAKRGVRDFTYAPLLAGIQESGLLAWCSRAYLSCCLAHLSLPTL